ncbi:Phage protein GP46 [compost metagenome]
MSDLALVFDGNGCDLAFDGNDLQLDDGLSTAILISLFSDRRARIDDTLPGATTDRRGWWADAYAQIPGDQIGSRLWLLGREKELAEPMRRAKEYVQEALAWLIADGIAVRVDVVPTVPRRGVLNLAITVQRADGSRENHQFDVLWESL